MNKIHLKIMVKSAHVFKNVNFFSKMHLYTVATIIEGDFSSSSSSSSSFSQSTMVDMHGGAQPFWWFPMKFQIDESKLLSQNIDLTLVLCIKCRRTTIGSNKKVGLVHLPVKVLLEYYWLNAEGNRPKHVAFMILSRSGKSRGVIYLSYMFGGEEMNTSIPPLPPPLLEMNTSTPPLTQPRLEMNTSIPPLPQPRLVPSAPPLPEHEDNGYHSGPPLLSAEGGYYNSAPTIIPSAPYLQEGYMLH